MIYVGELALLCKSALEIRVAILSVRITRVSQHLFYFLAILSYPRPPVT